MPAEKKHHAHEKVLPEAGSKVGKKEQVAKMFDQIAHRYDLLNHLLSAGIDRAWRKKAIASLAAVAPKIILDVATGTGDLAIAAMRLQPQQVIGVDISSNMLSVGRKKMIEKNLSTIIDLRLADTENLPFEDDHFDAVTCGYGVRNFENLEVGLKEMSRVMRKGGRLAILEFSKPKMFPIKQAFQIYFKYLLPAVGNFLSKNKRAYNYLQESAMAFPEGQEFVDILTSCGFKEVKKKPLAFGITTLYTASK